MSFTRSRLLHLLVRAYRPLYQRGLLLDGRREPLRPTFVPYVACASDVDTCASPTANGENTGKTAVCHRVTVDAHASLEELRS